MPTKTRQPAASTIRVRETRIRRKIAALQKSEDWYGWVVRQFYVDHDIEIAMWVRVDEVIDAELTDKNIKLGLLYKDKQAFIANLQGSASVEKAILRVKLEDIPLVRPKFLGNEVC